jgi:hypothetical protein
MNHVLKRLLPVSIAVPLSIALVGLGMTSTAAGAATPGASASTTGPNCEAQAPLAGSTAPIQVACYPTFAGAISAATNGRVNLIDATTSRRVTPAEMSAGLRTGPNINYVLSIDYSSTGFGGSTLTWTQTSPCGAYQAANMPSGWNDAVESVAAYSGCATTMFWNSNFGNPTYPIGVDGTSSNLGVFNNNTSSQKWCTAYGC